jgi:hypothetical protein
MPISWKLTGDRNVAAFYRGEANRLLFHLDQIYRNVSFGILSRKMFDGTVISVFKLFDNRIVYINGLSGVAVQEQIIRKTLIFLYCSTVDKMFYALSFPKSLTQTGTPPDFGHTDENSNSNFGALGYVINKSPRQNHIITIGTPYENWDLIQDNLSDAGIGKFPIPVLWDIPSICVHAHIRGGSEEGKWGTCGYEGDAIVPPLSLNSIPWPFKSISPFSYGGKKRTPNPTYSCWLPIMTNDGIVWKEDPQYTGNDWGISGKRNFKLNDAKTEALTWRDTLQVSGGGIKTSLGAFTFDGSPAGGFLVVTYG